MLELTEEALKENVPADKIITDGLTAGMQVVGEKFAAKEYFIPDMLASAEAVGAAMDVLGNRLQEKLAYSEGERDMIVLHHQFLAEKEGAAPAKIFCTMIDYGRPGGDSAMQPRLVNCWMMPRPPLPAWATRFGPSWPAWSEQRCGVRSASGRAPCR